MQTGKRIKFKKTTSQILGRGSFNAPQPPQNEYPEGLVRSYNQHSKQFQVLLFTTPEVVQHQRKEGYQVIDNGIVLWVKLDTLEDLSDFRFNSEEWGGSNEFGNMIYQKSIRYNLRNKMTNKTLIYMGLKSRYGILKSYSDEEGFCVYCEEPLEIQEQEKRRGGQIIGHHLQIECKNRNCPLFEVTTYADTIEQYYDNKNKLLTKWGII